ncbi:MAG: MacB family efflux pump subunit [Alphaproteobacteria bacterium]
MKPLLELSNICRYYESGDETVKALDGVSISVYPGEFVAVMGQSGSGKSTLMNIIGCLDTPTAGTYRVRGQDVAALDGDELAALRRQTFGFVFQRYNLLAAATAQENVAIPGLYDGMNRGEREGRAAELLERLGLGNRMDHTPSELSGGQQQRVAIARALMNDPPIVLADEPTGALDSHSGQEVMGLLKKLHAEGRTIILITHDEKVAANAERIIRMIDGKVSGDSKPLERAGVLAAEHRGRGAQNLLGTVGEAMGTAFRALHDNIFRTALTLLGIIIGVAAVVVMLAVGSGSKQKILDQITSLGTNLLMISPGMPGFRGGGDIVTLTPDDATAILDIPNVQTVVPERRSRQTLRMGNIDYATSVSGVGTGMPLVRDWKMEYGTFFNDRDLEGNASVIVLGQTVVKNLFPNEEDPIGKYILVKNIPFEVIGVLAKKGSLQWGGDQDDAAFIPLTTGMVRLFGGLHVSSITARVDNLDLIDETQDKISSLLKARHRAEDFNVVNTASIMEMASAAQNTLTILLGAVAAISLLVGGIGVMNIMLVSVTERTREIGIRMATGARMRDIMLQFNIEAAVVCTIGGILGLLIGFGLGFGISLFDVKVIFSFWPPALAFATAVLTGLVFGFLPARKAARMDPVVALSSE